MRFSFPDPTGRPIGICDGKTAERRCCTADNADAISGPDPVDALCTAFRRWRRQEAQRVMPHQATDANAAAADTGPPKSSTAFHDICDVSQFSLARQFLRPPVFPILGRGGEASIWVNEHSRSLDRAYLGRRRRREMQHAAQLGRFPRSLSLISVVQFLISPIHYADPSGRARAARRTDPGPVGRGVTCSGRLFCVLPVHSLPGAAFSVPVPCACPPSVLSFLPSCLPSPPPMSFLNHFYNRSRSMSFSGLRD